MHWIFGYGSLLWRPGFAHDEARPARLRGWRRRFWQGSPDHRGVPGAPGRVVTLVADDGAECLGIAYRLPAHGGETILAALDEREREGYLRRRLPILLDDGRAVQATTWVADPHNPHFLGAAPLPAIAEHVRASRGPSGTNLEYVLRLAGTLRDLGAPPGEDAFALEALLRP